jgi:hypothetical protein
VERVQPISEAWAYLSSVGVVYIARKDGEFLCEGPYERLDLGVPGRPEADDDTESCIRIFLTRTECEDYCAIWRELLGVGPNNQQLRPVKAILPDIWKHLELIVANSYVDYQVPPSIDLCTIVPGSYPVPIDSLFSELQEVH